MSMWDGFRYKIAHTFFSDMVFNSDMSLEIDRLTVQSEKDNDKLEDSDATIQRLRSNVHSSQQDLKEVVLLVAELTAMYDHRKAKGAYNQKMVQLAKLRLRLHRRGT